MPYQLLVLTRHESEVLMNFMLYILQVRKLDWWSCIPQNFDMVPSRTFERQVEQLGKLLFSCHVRRFVCFLKNRGVINFFFFLGQLSVWLCYSKTPKLDSSRWIFGPQVKNRSARCSFWHLWRTPQPPAWCDDRRPRKRCMKHGVEKSMQRSATWKFCKTIFVSQGLFSTCMFFFAKSERFKL